VPAIPGFQERKTTLGVQTNAGGSWRLQFFGLKEEEGEEEEEAEAEAEEEVHFGQKNAGGSRHQQLKGTCSFSGSKQK